MELLPYAIKFVVAGTFVIGFAALGEALEPNRFAGLFSAAPSVLLASLLVAVFIDTPAEMRSSALGAIAGAVGLVAYSLVASWSLERFGGIRGSMMGIPAWCAASAVVYVVLMVGVPCRP